LTLFITTTIGEICNHPPPQFLPPS
jgi:hypothetical protein